jgi:hypothetical protein
MLASSEVPGEIGLTWGKGSSAPRETCAEEQPLEKMVSEYVGALLFLWLAVEDDPGPASHRALLERNSIALLSNYEKPGIDPSSPGWLGLHSGERLIRESGLWNSNHVDGNYDPSFLGLLGDYVTALG